MKISLQSSLHEVEVVTATVDLEAVRAYRSSISRSLQAAHSQAKYQRIQTHFELSPDDIEMDILKFPTPPITPRLHGVEEEIALCAGCYLWDVGFRVLDAPVIRANEMACSISEEAGVLDTWFR